MLLVLLLVCELMEENCSFLNLILCGKQEKQEKVVFLILFVKSVDEFYIFKNSLKNNLLNTYLAFFELKK